MHRHSTVRRPLPPHRRGAIFVLSAFLLIVAFAFAAFAIDLGYITLTRGELQKSADAAALAAVIELGDGYGPGATRTQAQIDAAAREAAVAVASANRAGGRSSVYASGGRDVRLGQYVWDSDSSQWVKAFGVQPYTLAEVTLRRDQSGSANGDKPLDLFFAPIIGHRKADVTMISTSALLPGQGIRVRPGSGRKADVLPITLDIGTWEDLMDGVGNDQYSYNPETGAVTSGPDGIREVNLYPEGKTQLPPGNRGTVDFGHSGNSTADISRQIRYGLSESDLAHFGGELNFKSGPLVINGDTGLSAGIKDDLEAIKGLPRLIPLFTSVSGPGNNANYVIPKLVGVRIMDVKLTGAPAQKRVIIQPAPFVSDVVVPGDVQIASDSYFAPAGLIP